MELKKNTNNIKKSEFMDILSREIKEREETRKRKQGEELQSDLNQFFESLSRKMQEQKKSQQEELKNFFGQALSDIAIPGIIIHEAGASLGWKFYQYLILSNHEYGHHKFYSLDKHGKEKRIQDLSLWKRDIETDQVGEEEELSTQRRVEFIKAEEFIKGKKLLEKLSNINTMLTYKKQKTSPEYLGIWGQDIKEEEQEEEEQ